ncbi:histidinol-phosphate transaminase [Actinoplanes sp. NEAU-A12]|uniref:histidinol-phosphate transaminase n=1 Tax=Actinoplanes sandaracinus TaxID=3045177 RepID=A0ABT6WX39_9ACTN|nr:histidinol-phosphate transaminase [Actinoplanes sandaracinus]MDI6104305.1 histidinol-phosphate transaminase [Actinoplanes sandaracinus]
MDESLLLPATAAPFQLDPQGVERLALSESAFGPSPRAISAAMAEVRNAHLYPNADSEPVRLAVASLYGLDPGQVVVGNGADELLLLIALACGGHRVRATVCASTFAGHAASLAVAGCEVTQLPIDDTGLALTDLLTAAETADVLYVCNPHNPTGTVLGADQIATLAAHSRRYGCALVLDEAYAEFADARVFGSGTGMVADDNTAPVVVIRSLSKAYGLAGLRCGFALGPPALMNRVARIAATLPYRVNRVSLAAAGAALADRDHLEWALEQTTHSREWLRRELSDQGFRVPPTQTNFLFAHLGDDGPQIVERLLTEHSILVRDLTGMGFPGWARIGVCRPEFVPRLAGALTAVRDDASADTKRSTTC